MLNRLVPGEPDYGVLIRFVQGIEVLEYSGRSRSCYDPVALDLLVS